MSGCFCPISEYDSSFNENHRLKRKMINGMFIKKFFHYEHSFRLLRNFTFSYFMQKSKGETCVILIPVHVKLQDVQDFF